MQRKVIDIQEFRTYETAIPVPPNLEPVIGYRGNARLVAFYWSNRDDALICDDGGGCRGRLYSWHWIKFENHEAVKLLLKTINYGTSDREPEAWLLLDREKRILSYGRPSVVKATVEKKNSQICPTKNPYQQITKISQNEQREMILNHMIESHHQEIQMIEWLDQVKEG